MTPTFLLLTALCTDTFHVRADGVDDAARDGLSPETAFASLAYACERLPDAENATDPNTIQVGPGEFLCSRPAIVPSNTNIFGNGFHGKGDNFSRLVTSTDWQLRDTPCEGPLEDESLIVLKKKSSNIRVSGIQLESPEDHRLTGGITMDACSDIKIDTCRFRNFRWFGIHSVVCSDVEIAGCSFRHCSTDKCRHRLGQIATKWLKDSTVHHCRIEPNPDGGGYGYKGGGHTNVRIHDNTFLPSYFSIESPHENEHGLEIDHNILNGAVSVPKGGPGADPAKRGFEYAVEIHHNVMTDSYAIEGPRNHLRVHHNHIHINKPNGRVYSQFGGINHGPVRFDHNVIENVDRAIIWVRTGLAQNVTFEANTVFTADAFDRNGALFSAWKADHIDDWIIRDNVIVAAWNRPRRLLQAERGVPDKIRVENNLCINVDGVPEGNVTDTWPEFRRGEAAKPWHYFAPKSATGPTVDRGVRPADGDSNGSPDIGAVEWGRDFEPVGPRR